MSESPNIPTLTPYRRKRWQGYFDPDATAIQQSCGNCGALVIVTHRDTHVYWHERVDTDIARAAGWGD